MLKKLGKIDKAVEELSAMLDTFYTEVEAWLELADIYLSCHQYATSTFTKGSTRNNQNAIDMIMHFRLSLMPCYWHLRTLSTSYTSLRQPSLCRTSRFR